MLDDLLCPVSATIADALRRIDRNARGISCLHDDDRRIVAIMTDGDIRRALLHGAALDTPARGYANSDFFWMPHGLAHETYTSELNGKRQHVLILDEQRRLTALISFKSEAVLPVASINLVGNELNYVTQCIQTNWISSQGKFVSEFEKVFASYHDMPYASTTSNGTTALHLALVALGIGPGDEVLVPASTFGATANAVIHAGGVPVFVDIEADTWCMNPALLEQAITPATKAVIPVHLYGNPADMDAIARIAKKYSLFIVEDCAESLGALLSDGTPTGTKSNVSCFSFFSNKVITTGEGGMVLTRDKDLHRKMRQLRDHGTSLERKYWHDYPGFNYRMTNIQAAIGLAQMERLKEFLHIRERIAVSYKKRLEALPGLQMQTVKPGCTAINWLFTVVVTPDFTCNRDALMEILIKQKIDVRPFFPALFHQPAYASYRRKNEFPVALRMEREGCSLPTSNFLSTADIDRVCDAIVAIGRNEKRSC